ncbi:MAG: hypothetical protein KGH98_02085 [Candidatus Micrarchaeota archaeon]|nr:hypothetical protein [Candidatus Micrarchaeota archaeon]
MEEEQDPFEGAEKIEHQTVETLVKAMLNTSYGLLMHSFDTMMSDKVVGEDFKKGIISYIYTTGFLSFCGREINKENVMKMLRLVDVEPDEKMIDDLLHFGVKSTLVYGYVYYYLIANGVHPTEERMSSVIEALGLKPDPERIRYVLQFVSISPIQ